MSFLTVTFAAVLATPLALAQAPDCNGYFSTHAAHDFSSDSCEHSANPHFYFVAQCEGATLGCCKSCGACCAGVNRQTRACTCDQMPFGKALCRSAAEQDFTTCQGTCAHNFNNCSTEDLNWSYSLELDENDKCPES